MRKILLIVAMLLIAAAPAMAKVTVNARHTGMPTKAGIPCTTCEVNYVCDNGEKVRAFALEITVDNGYTITGIRDFNVGESNKAPNTGRGYGIFPGKFRDFINAADPNWTADANYNPIAPVTDTDAPGTGLGTSKIIVELGSLYVGDNNAPQSAATLFRFDIMGPTGKTTNIGVAVNTTRGGVVLEDGNSLVVGPTTLVLAGSTGGLTDTFPCYAPWTTQYSAWVDVFKPKCWSGTYLDPADANWRTQCWGDADGKYEGTGNKYRVYQSDYTKLLQAWGKKATALRAGMGVDGNWMCADADHKYEGTGNKYRVYQSDYSRMLYAWGKKETTLRPAPYGWCPQ
jgi:hypothetical protein